MKRKTVWVGTIYEGLKIRYLAHGTYNTVSVNTNLNDQQEHLLVDETVEAEAVSAEMDM